MIFNDFILNDIDKRMRYEFLAKEYSRPFVKTIIIVSAYTFLPLNNDLYHLINELIDVPLEYRVTIQSADNFLKTSRKDYESIAYKVFGFRDYIEVKVENYGTTIIPFKLEFIMTIPEG